MAKSHEGIVIAVHEDMAKVKVARHSSCENCGSCPGSAALVVDAINTAEAKPGQRVLVQIKERNMLKAAFVVCMLPLVGIIAGTAGGNYIAETFSLSATIPVVGGLAGFLLAVRYVLSYERKAKKDENMQPIVERILSQQPKG